VRSRYIPKRQVRERASRVANALRVGLAVLLYLACQALRAEDSTSPLTGFVHTAWTTKNGAPSVIHDLAQTTDGTLWIASESGLFHFDGLRFVRFDGKPGHELSSSIFTLFAPRTGGLWIGARFGGVAFLKNGEITDYPPGDGVPGGTVYGIVQDSNGVLWVSTTGGLARFENGRWQSAEADWELPPGAKYDLLIDRSGTLWAGMTEGFYFLRRGSHRFMEEPRVRIETLDHRGLIAESLDGTIWIADPKTGVRPLGSRSGLSGAADGHPLQFDREGALWYTTGAGMQRLTNPRAFADAREVPHIERFDSRDGLSNDGVKALFEDREGNVWVGTRNGLNRFARTSLRMVVRTGANAFALASARDGTMWWSQHKSEGDPARIDRIFHFDNGEAVEQLTAPSITCAFRDDEGTLWFGGEYGLWRLEGARLHSVPLPESTRNFAAQAMVRDRAGALWYSVQRKGVFRYAHGEWVLNGNLAALPHEPAIVMTADGRGRLWFGYTNERVALVEEDSARMFGAGDGLRIGHVTAIGARGDHVWIGGEHGLMRFDGTRFVPVRVAGEDPFRSVWGVVETATGELWATGGAGIVRLTRAQVAEVLQNQPTSLRPRVFDYRDGLPGSVQVIRPTPALVEAGDGRLWFASSDGVGFIDPAHIERNAPPPVTIWALTTTGHDYSPFARDLRLPVGTTELQIGYTAGSLTVPERVRFRYRLEGLDETWQDVGDRREAVYTNLGPGPYTFRVIASSNDGVWNATGATLAFTIPPAFYQTRWFYALCALAAIAVLALLYRLRMRQVAAAVRALLEERIVERERIARDLHDTLLQSFQGLLLRFQTVYELFPTRPAEAKEILRSAIDQTAQAITEGRDTVQGLRASTVETNDLAVNITRLGEELAAEAGSHTSVGLSVEVEGTPRTLHPIVRDEIYRIASEALRNAFRHAGAKQIEVELRYDERQLRLRVRDDGRGIDPMFLTAEGRAGHFGLHGIRERANLMGGKLTVWTAPDSGTEIELGIRAAHAYAVSPAPRRSWFAEKFSGKSAQSKS
jgi:signal transduction histidine kinase/ligand-binding sensor domain-containing protein